jgi:stringent starvation protein B
MSNAPLPTMTSSKPYFIRALYEWILDNGLTPYIVIDAEYPGTDVPRQFVEKGGIILNISPVAANALLVTNDHVEFHARFGGIAKEIYAPIASIKAIYARENGRGMTFTEEDTGGSDGAPPPSGPQGGSTATGPAGKKPTLRVVK